MTKYILVGGYPWKALDGGRAFAEELVAGSSVGAHAISKYYYGLDDLKIGEGLGLLPIKAIVHYRSDYNAPNIDWDKAEVELKNYKEELPILTLSEGQFEIIVK